MPDPANNRHKGLVRNWTSSGANTAGKVRVCDTAVHWSTYSYIKQAGHVLLVSACTEANVH